MRPSGPRLAMRPGSHRARLATGRNRWRANFAVPGRPSLYAYRDTCPGCAGAIHTGTLDGNGAHLSRRADSVTTFVVPGRSLENRELHLEPVPLLEDAAGVRIALAGASRMSAAAAIAKRPAAGGAARFVNARRAQAPVEKCEMCAPELAPGHSHIVNIESRSLMCACRACYLLFTAAGSGAGQVQGGTRPPPDLRSVRT